MTRKWVDAGTMQFRRGAPDARVPALGAEGTGMPGFAGRIRSPVHGSVNEETSAAPLSCVLPVVGDATPSWTLTAQRIS